MRHTFWVVISTGCDDGHFSSVLHPAIFSGSLVDFSFDTVSPGGFGTSRLFIPIKRVLGHTLLNYHVRVVDFFGRIVYEGRIESTAVSGGVVQASVNGYYSHGEDKTHGLIYPISTPKSVSEIVLDSIQLTSFWNKSSLADVITTTTDVTPQDFTGETKITEAISEVLKYGSDDTIPRALHFGIWEDRSPVLKKEPLLTDVPDWVFPLSKISSGGRGATENFELGEVYNKIQVIYDDRDIGSTFTDWAEDTDSQNLYGIREGTISIGRANSVIAEVVRDLAIARYPFPSGSANIKITGYVRTGNSGTIAMPYLVRAGDLVKVEATNRLSGASYNYLGSAVTPYLSFIVSRTSYDLRKNELTVEFSRRSKSFDILMARLGLSSVSIK